MTIEEAIDEIKSANDEEVRYGDQSRHADAVEKRLDAFYLAFEALKLQIPKKPKISIRGTTDCNTHCSCPICENFVAGNYCANCGQRIDWSTVRQTYYRKFIVSELKRKEK